MVGEESGGAERSAQELLPGQLTLDNLRQASAGCRACELWRTGTQTVFGEGVTPAELMLIGEQPGDREDIDGRPFVGPAGAILDRALSAAGLERASLYLTNAVKHFRWVPRGKRRLHQKPDAGHIAACFPWLRAEVELARPGLVICLGATAAQAVIGPAVRVLRDRGRVVPSALGVPAMPTVHPSSILRAPDDEAREQAFQEFVVDLRAGAQWLSRG